MAPHEELPTASPAASDNSPKPHGGGGGSSPRLARWRARLREPLDPRRADWALFLCALISGLTDAAAFAAWATFLSMQTGNTVFLALGASGQPANAPDSWLKSLVSIACFVAGCFLFPRAMRAAGGGGAGGGGGARARGAVAGSFLVQTVLCAIAGALVRAGVVPGPKGLVTPAEQRPGDPLLVELAGIGLLAFQAAGQIVASRALGYSEIPTVVLTSVYCDLAGDPLLFGARNPKRDRRAAAVVLILVGGIAGGWIARSPAGMDVVIWTAAFLKLVICVAALLWKRAPELET